MNVRAAGATRALGVGGVWCGLPASNRLETGLAIHPQAGARWLGARLCRGFGFYAVRNHAATSRVARSMASGWS